MSAPLFHIVGRQTWQRAVAAGVYAPASLRDEGFVHCSFAEQVEQVANARFADVAGPDGTELVVVELDPGRIDAQVIVEDSYRSGTSYPHIYGPVPPAARVAEHAVQRDADGTLRIRL